MSPRANISSASKRLAAAMTLVAAAVISLPALAQDGKADSPWAWGINGCASVLSAILAVLLAIEIGFSGVMLIAAGLYVIAWLNRI